MNKGLLLIISAPSGAGKTSLIRALLARDSRLRLSISHTTRPPRPGEVDGVDYHFVSVEQFMQLTAECAFLEQAEVFGNYYGTSAQGVQDQLDAGHDVIVEIDWQGARQVRKAFPKAASIFIIPPSIQALKERLSQRGQDDETVIAQRMAAARREIEHYGEYDYLIVNDDFEIALQELHAIILAERCKIERSIVHHQDLLFSLLNEKTD